MTSSTSSPTPVLIFALEIPGRLPSWNEVLAMHHWKRKKFKDQLAQDFLSVLRASAADSLTNQTFATSTMKTFADTLASCLTTRRESAKVKSANARQRKAKKKEL